jgi:2-polyprenyl-6-methoxyphenol hydroxylase-like FAD-dependent oxidoreductase
MAPERAGSTERRAAVRTCDVVIVGGGIGGGALATALARDGLEVVLLEASEAYEDRVRGESMLPWGVREARALGVEQVLVGAGAHVAPAWVQYDAAIPTDVSEANPIPVGAILPDVDGSMNLRHPEACAAFAAAAVDSGVELHRAVRDVAVSAGAAPRISCATPAARLEFAPRLVVGADGRNSTVRRQTGIELHRAPEPNMIAGLLVEGLDITDEFDFLATHDDLFMASFHQGHGRLRVYLCPGVSQRHRFSGPGGLAHFRDSMDFACLPFGKNLRDAEPAGPLATYPGDDSWTDEPFVEGVVLVGDAAGFSNPLIGQGLSIAMRDARTVRDVLRGDDWSPAAFGEYATERLERMRRLRAGSTFMAAAFAEDCDDRAQRRARAFQLRQEEPLVLGLLIALFGGPESGPEEAFDGRLTDAVRGAP